MCLYRKYIVENGGDAESHGDFCCWQLMYRSVKLKGTSVNEEKKKKRVSWLVFAGGRQGKGSA